MTGQIPIDPKFVERLQTFLHLRAREREEGPEREKRIKELGGDVLSHARAIGSLLPPEIQEARARELKMLIEERGEVSKAADALREVEPELTEELLGRLDEEDAASGDSTST